MVALDKAKEGSVRLGALVQIYIGPKMFQALEGTTRTLSEPDARVSNEARAILEKTLPAFRIKDYLPLITTEPATLETLNDGTLKGIGRLVPRVEAGIGDIQGEGPATSAYRFAQTAVHYMQLRKYVPHHSQEIQAARKSLVDYGALLYVGESQVKEFLADPKGRWTATFDLVTAKQKRTFVERLMPKELKYPLDGEKADALIRRWREGM